MSQTVYRFGEFRVDPVAREFWRGARLVAVPPHVFDCLAYLVERHDRAVGRDELVAAVWGRTEVSDTLIGQTILRIRREVGDDGKDPRFLRTIPRFGFRWVAPLEREPRQLPAEPGALDAANDRPRDAEGAARDPVERLEARSTRASSAPRMRPSMRSAAVAAIVAVILLTGVWAVVKRVPAPASGGSARPTAAPDTAGVVPAIVNSGAEWSWMRFGVMDLVATRLRSSGLPTVPSESLIALLNAPNVDRSVPLRDIAGFSLLVSPRIARRGEAWQVSLDADDAGGRHFAVEASAREVTIAARDATDRLLVALGRLPPAGVDDPAPNAELVKRIDAAVLADDPDGARALIEAATPAQRQTPDVGLRLAKIDFRGGRLDAASTRLDALLAEAPAQESPVLRAAILNGLGAVAIRRDDPKLAARHFDESIGLLANRHEPAQLGQAYLGRAAAAADQRQFAAASVDYARARVALRQANDSLALLRVDANEGFLDLDQGRPSQALPQLVAAGAGFARWGALNEAVFAYIGQIACHLAGLESAAAMHVADMAAAAAVHIDNTSTHESLDIARARALAAVGRLREARSTLERIRDAHAAPGDATGAVAGVALARLDLQDNRPLPALESSAAAVRALADPVYANLRSEAWLTAIEASVRLRNEAEAQVQMAAFAAWADQDGPPPARLRVALARAQIAWRFGDGKTWRSAFEDAGQAAREGGVPADVARVATEYADALIGEGDLDAAAVEVGRVSRWADRDFGCAILEARLYAALGRNEARQTAVARARAMAGERGIPADALASPISARAASTR